eukprot:GHVU01035712.1.p1 GENE.GHVU01035712.1~~GHVU01035712.1.p1  ORF type:complete len:123 (+),score=4.02 GHVU01035712.1:1302-1670(+)
MMQIKRPQPQRGSGRLLATQLVIVCLHAYYYTYCRCYSEYCRTRFVYPRGLRQPLPRAEGTDLELARRQLHSRLHRRMISICGNRVLDCTVLVRFTAKVNTVCMWLSEGHDTAARVSLGRRR